LNPRQRLVPALLGLAAFSVLGYQVDHQLWLQWWFYVAVGMAIAHVFLEPWIPRPGDSVANAGGGIAAWASADRSPGEPLWTAFFTLCLLVALAGATAALLPKDTSGSKAGIKRVSYQFATRIGRAIVVGALALGLEALRLAHEGGDSYVYLSMAIALLVVALAPNWPKVLRDVTNRQQSTGSVLAMLGPSVVLARLPGSTVKPGQGCRLVTTNGQSAEGWVVAILPGANGRRYEVALAQDASEVFEQLPTEVQIEPDANSSAIAGVVGAGSTDLAVVFNPMRRLSAGDPLVIGDGQETLIYQVTGLELRRETWLADSAIIPRAEAVQVGHCEAGRIRTAPRLPSAHQLLRLPGPLRQALPAAHQRIGVLKGAEIEIGIDVLDDRTGHFAILGISGMGKTTAALRVARALATDCCVVALDTTGEYRTRQSVDANVPFNWDTPGLWVHEPTGDPPIVAADYIRQIMTAANAEYVAGGAVPRRVILLEEAHGFVPEINISTFPQRDATALSTRMIMQSRKFSVRFMFVSQRTAVISKSALSQCENYVAFRSTDETSLTYLNAALGEGVGKLLPRLGRYEAVCLGPAFNADGPVVVSLDPP
jgi:hypothetical protein